MGSAQPDYLLFSFVESDEDVAEVVNVTKLRNRLIVSMACGLRYSDLSYNGKIAVLQKHFPGLSYDAIKNIIGARPANAKLPEP